MTRLIFHLKIDKFYSQKCVIVNNLCYFSRNKKISTIRYLKICNSVIKMQYMLQRCINTTLHRHTKQVFFFMGRPDSSVGCVLGFWTSLIPLQVRIPLATLAKISIIEKINYLKLFLQRFDCHLPGCGGLRGIVERRELSWLSLPPLDSRRLRSRIAEA